MREKKVDVFLFLATLSSTLGVATAAALFTEIRDPQPQIYVVGGSMVISVISFAMALSSVLKCFSLINENEHGE